MNENIDLTKILKDCPEGTKFYSTIFGEVEFMNIVRMGSYLISFKTKDECVFCVDLEGKYMSAYNGECTLFPSREQRDWSKFTAPWHKKERFDPRTLQPFDRVLCRNSLDIWRCDFFSSYNGNRVCPNVCIGDSYLCCIPYNDETKHLVGTNDEAPEYYRYWED